MKLKKSYIAVALLFLFAVSAIAGSGIESVKTVDNLKEAVIGETAASAKYAAYAQKARQEGFGRIALLFEATSKSESIHAGNHIAALEQLGVEFKAKPKDFEVKSTRENLQDAINGESYEVATMYPEFLKTADGENINIAKISFGYAYQTEKKHKVLYQNALEQLDAGKEQTLSTTYSVCSTCGNTYDGVAPKRCGISMTPGERFISISETES